MSKELWSTRSRSQWRMRQKKSRQRLRWAVRKDQTRTPVEEFLLRMRMRTSHVSRKLAIVTSTTGHPSLYTLPTILDNKLTLTDRQTVEAHGTKGDQVIPMSDLVHAFLYGASLASPSCSPIESALQYFPDLPAELHCKTWNLIVSS